MTEIKDDSLFILSAYRELKAAALNRTRKKGKFHVKIIKKADKQTPKLDADQITKDLGIPYEHMPSIWPKTAPLKFYEDLGIPYEHMPVIWAPRTDTIRMGDEKNESSPT